jgi:threonine dehydratase
VRRRRSCRRIALALPGTRILTVEPDGWDDMAESLFAGRPVPVREPAPPTRCDALQTRLVSPLTLAALSRSGASGVTVTEAEIEVAMAFAGRHLRLVVEPGGAVALAALLAGKAGPVSERTVVVVSGGNVDPALYAGIVAAQAAETVREAADSSRKGETASTSRVSSSSS